MNVEKNIPYPTTGGRGLAPKYPFSCMAVGDSIFAEGETSQGLTANSARQFGTRYGSKWSCRKEANGVRIWRIA